MLFDRLLTQTCFISFRFVHLMACVIRPSRNLEAIKFMKVDIKLNCRVSAGGDEESGRWERNIVSKLNAYRLHTHTHTLSRGFWYRKLRPCRNCVNRWCCGRPIIQFQLNSIQRKNPVRRERFERLFDRERNVKIHLALAFAFVFSLLCKQNKTKQNDLQSSLSEMSLLFSLAPSRFLSYLRVP